MCTLGEFLFANNFFLLHIITSNSSLALTSLVCVFVDEGGGRLVVTPRGATRRAGKKTTVHSVQCTVNSAQFNVHSERTQ